jgi:hypothetical protein
MVLSRPMSSSISSAVPLVMSCSASSCRPAERTLAGLLVDSDTEDS